MSGRDRIRLSGIRGFAHHGVVEAERETGQVFVVDVVLEVDTRPAAKTDDLRLTVNWNDLAVRLERTVTATQYRLVETLAARLARECLTEEPVAAVEVTVHKPQAPIPLPCVEVAVTIRRERDAHPDPETSS